MDSNGNPVVIDVWWVPDCGYLHHERESALITLKCPDGVEPEASDG